MAHSIIYALIGGILPALIWLVFWLREDRKNPEPRLFIFRTFLFGMLAVVLITVTALIFEDRVGSILGHLSLSVLVALAALEEILKLGAAYLGGLSTKEDNEPLDPIIYMITAALGFVALENALFILGPLLDGEITQSIITGHMRFIGASLLHVVSSGLIGIAMAFSFYKSRSTKFIIIVLALAGAIVIHTFFNVIITVFKDTGSSIASVAVWVGVIFILWAFERAKTIAR